MRTKIIHSVVALTLAFPAGAVVDSLLDKYDALMAKETPKKLLENCVAPKLNTNREARRYRTTLTKTLREKPPSPNFCGRYFIFNEPITGGGILFLADCETGKVQALHEEYASLAPYAKVQSCLLIEHAPSAEDTLAGYHPSVYGPPRLYRWTGTKLEKVPDPILPPR